jgi:hypothetical protein
MDEIQRLIAERIANKEIRSIHDFMRIHCRLVEIPDTFSSHHFGEIGIKGLSHFERQKTAYRYEDRDETVEMVYAFMDFVKFLGDNGFVRLRSKDYNRLSDTGLLRIAPQPTIPTSGIDTDMFGIIKDYVTIEITPTPALRELLNTPPPANNPIGFKID